jgi:CRP/FNR family transcriptional regulator, cyclic AMP receptor protein
MAADEKPRLPLHRPVGDGSSLDMPSAGGQRGRNHDGVVNFFRSVNLFDELSAEQIIEVLRVAHIETHPAGTVLAKEGDAADAMYIIERGEVAITKASLGGDDVRVAYLGDGSVVGEMALIVGSPRTASVEAVAETRVYRLSGRDFDSLRRQRSVAAYKILTKLLVTLGDRRHRVLDRLDEIHGNPADYVDEFRRHAVEMAEQIAENEGE